jgi:Flp pilus assembly protein TadD
LWIDWGNAFELSGNVERAAHCYKRALRVSPCEAMAMNNLGELELAGGNSSAARLWFERALAQDPDHPRFLANREKVLEVKHET